MYGMKQMKEVKSFMLEMSNWLIEADKDYYVHVEEHKLAKFVEWMTIHSEVSKKNETINFSNGKEKARAKKMIRELLKKEYTMSVLRVFYDVKGGYRVTFHFRGTDEMFQKKLMAFQSLKLEEAAKVPLDMYLEFEVPVGKLPELRKAIHCWAK